MDPTRRALLVRATYRDDNLGRCLGREGYSYRYVYRAFAPLLARWAQTTEVTGPDSALDAALAAARARGLDPLHLSFLPLHRIQCTSQAPNVAAIAWEYPEVPSTDLHGDPRNNWVRAADAMDMVIAHTHYAREALRNSGVRTPVHVVPIPIHPDHFAVPAWQPGATVVLDVPCYVFPPPGPHTSSTGAIAPTGPRPAGVSGLCRKALDAVPGGVGRGLRKAVHAARVGFRAARAVWRAPDIRKVFPPRAALELSGVVYTTVFNPLDGRKNWIDLLLGFMQALGDRPDAQLVVKLVVAPEHEAEILGQVHACYVRAGGAFRCRVAFLTAYLSDEQMLRLARASTYYLNTSHGEGSCLPLQSFLAAGRPAVAPGHTGMADSVDDRCAFVIEAHPEPTCFPIDLEGPNLTRWYRLVWQSLSDQLRASYDVARNDLGRYRAMSEAGRQRMARLTHPDSVWPVLSAALEQAWCRGGGATRRAG
jgi:glycosyltransferase involved in cell wall biosynthesis